MTDINVLRDRVADLAIRDPDPTDYDRGANDMLRRVLGEIDRYGAETRRPMARYA